MTSKRSTSNNRSDPGTRGDSDGFDHEVTVTATFETPAAADTVFEAIQVEAGEIADDRTRASVSRAGRAVVVTIQAGDLTALRAGTRTWTGLLDVASTIATGDGAE